MRNRELEMMVMVAYDESGFDDVKQEAIEKAVAPFKPDYIECAGDRSVRIAFKRRPGSRVDADDVSKSLQNCLLRIPLLSGVRVGGGAGRCACRTDVWGRVTEVHLGDVTYQAMREAVC
jgi:hypothetical protein